MSASGGMDWQADNSVLNSIRDISSLLQIQYLHICDNCTDIIREFSLYRWDRSATEDRPIKENDHAMDDMRYFVRTTMTRTLKAIRRR